MSGILPSIFNVVNGAANVSSTSATTVISAPSEGAVHLTSLQLGRTDNVATAIFVTMNDLNSTPLAVPGSVGGGVVSYVFDSPLVFANKTAVTVTPSSAVNALLIGAQGFLRP
jgi:hypothetical protein